MEAHVRQFTKNWHRGQLRTEIKDMKNSVITLKRKIVLASFVWP